jgi:cytochrome b561
MSVQATPRGYTSTQIMLHWTVAILVAFQFFLNDGIGDAWRAIAGGNQPTDDAMGAANIHATMGLLILALALWRIVLRLTLGAPPAPDHEPLLLRRIAKGVHVLLYALILLVPMSGAAAWFGGVAPAATAHNVFKALLLITVVLHIGGALVQHFVLRSDVLTRMLVTRD